MKRVIYLNNGSLKLLDDSFDIKKFYFLNEEIYKKTVLLGALDENLRRVYLGLCLRGMLANPKTAICYNIFSKTDNLAGFIFYLKFKPEFLKEVISKEDNEKLSQMNNVWELTCGIHKNFMNLGLAHESILACEDLLIEGGVNHVLAIVNSNNLKIKNLLLKLDFYCFFKYSFLKKIMREVYIKDLI